MGMFRGFVSAPLLVKAGVGSGIVGGLALGAMVSPPVLGLSLGIGLGATIGTIAGLVMEREAKRRSLRTKELDEMIGVTSGSMGVPPGSIPPRDLARDPDASLELKAWVEEWLTPPPPTTSQG